MLRYYLMHDCTQKPLKTVHLVSDPDPCRNVAQLSRFLLSFGKLVGLERLRGTRDVFEKRLVIEFLEGRSHLPVLHIERI